MRPFFIKDPIRAENPEVFTHLRRQISVPIATGEQLASKWEWHSARWRLPESGSGCDCRRAAAAGVEVPAAHEADLAAAAGQLPRMELM